MKPNKVLDFRESQKHKKVSQWMKKYNLNGDFKHSRD